MMGGTGETKIGKKHMEILLADLLISLLEVDEEEKTEMETFLEKYPFTALLREYPVLGLSVETERKLEAIAMLESYDGRDVSWRKIEEYSKQFDLLHIVDHPIAAGVTEAQYKKIVQLREFLNAYQSLRKIEWEERIILSGSERSKEYFISQLAYYREREMILCAYLDSGCGVISCEKVAEGTVDRSPFFTRELLKRVLQLDAVGVVLAHNHPGNSLKASEQDIAITNQLRDALGALAIKVFDHIIVGADRAVSLYQEGIIPADHQFQDGIAMVNLYESEENGYER